MRVDLITLTCSKLEDLSFVGFRGKEEISRPYEIELFFTVPLGTAVKDAVGERATLKAHRGEDAEPLVFHGVIAQTRMLHQTAERALYRALLVPKLWMLRHFWRSFVFTGKKVDEFLTDTLKAGGLASSEFRFNVDAGYPKEEFVAQYRETLLDFFHRWCEREGLYYYFEHKDGEPSEVLVIVDNKSLHDDFPGGGRVKYAPIFGDDATAPPGLHQVEADVRWLPKTVTIADYNYANPSASVKSDSDVTEKGLGQIREYGARVFGEGDAKRIAKVRAESIGCRESTLRASGSVIGPRAGYRFGIDDKPDELEESWLAVEVEHEGSLAGAVGEVARLTGIKGQNTYKMKLFAVPASEQYRAPQATPWPRIYGFENAVVGGPGDSPYAQIDTDGRYLVRFEFDTSDLPDAQVSTRVRMLQPHGGSNEGFHFPLRKGTEVMIGFLGGDPDRPFIAGVVPNAQKPSVVGERNRTQNIIRTGSGNQMVMEDEQGKEFMFLSTPNNRTGVYLGAPAGNHSNVYTGEDTTTGTFHSPVNAIPGGVVTIVRDVEFSYLRTTEGAAGLWVGGDVWENAMSDKYLYVQGHYFRGIGMSYTSEIGEAAEETYHANLLTKIKRGKEEIIEAEGMVHTITDKLHQTVNGDGWQHVTGTWKHDVDGENWDDYGTWKTTVANGWTATVGSDVSVTSSRGGVTIRSPMTITIESTGADVKIKSPNSWHKFTKMLLETYAQKTSFGVMKLDNTALNTSTNALKMEVTRTAMAMTLLKMDVANAKLEKKDLYAADGQLNLEKVSSKIHQGALKVMNWAFTKM